jgi:SNF2 family DNA or RNA helicase
LRGDLREY